MPWRRRESHDVSIYTFDWFTDEEGAWLVVVWKADAAPSRAVEARFGDAVAVHYIPPDENPKGRRKPMRQFCSRFLSDIPFRARAIQNKIPTLRRLADEGKWTPPEGAFEPKIRWGRDRLR